MILSFAASAVAQAAGPGCDPWLKSYFVYKTSASGQPVSKLETFAITDWSPDMSYQGFVLSAAPPATAQSVLEIGFTGDSGKLKSKKIFKRQAGYPGPEGLRHFPDFVAEKFFRFKESGQYTVTLKDQGRIICTETHAYRFGEPDAGE